MRAQKTASAAGFVKLPRAAAEIEKATAAEFTRREQFSSLGLAARIHEECMKALLALVADRAGAERMGAAGRALAVARYNGAAPVPRLAALLRRLA